MFNRLMDKEGHIKNFICLLAKHYIYRKRCFLKKLNFPEFSRNVKKIESYEQMYAFKNNRISKHFKKWKGQIPQEIRDNYIEQYVDQINVEH